MDSETRILHKLDDIQTQVTDLREEVRVGFAHLPSTYVTRETMKEWQRQTSIIKRFAVASIISSIGALSMVAGVIAVFS